MIDAVTARIREIDREPLSDSDGLSLANRRSAVIDELVRALFEPFESEVVAVAAVGGYGRSELTPGSDIDLMFLFRG
ncbi:MAG TPA: nucleotidyltransferase domain-containing protein, partial [Actinomycetota bacterium]|nr:nucleotidyltransferase domain-containing protein [Actinomycetota bacterium]